MVVLRICSPSNPNTINFDQPLQKPSHMRLLSCTLYNSWFNLKKRGDMTWFTTGPNKEGTVLTIPPGHYNATTMGEHIDHIFKNEEVKVLTATNQPDGALVLHKRYKLQNFKHEVPRCKSLE